MQNNLKRAIDTDLRCLRTTQRERNILFQNTLEGIKVKKKLSTAFVLVLVLVIASAVALAATLAWETYAAEVKQIEQEQGEYEQWPLEEKLTLIQNLLEMGYLEESGNTAKLFDSAASQTEQLTLADDIMLELTGQTEIREINLDIITYAILGPESTWTPEQQVWWQGITNMYREAGDPDTLVLPGGDEISEADAVRIAKAAILEAYELPENALDNALPVANLYVTDQRPDYKRWDVQFQLFREGSDNYLVRVYSAIVDETGDVIADPDLNAPSLEEKAADYKERQASDDVLQSPIIEIFLRYTEEQSYNQFVSWPIEVKAAYTAEVRPMVEEALESGDLEPFEGSSNENKAVIVSTYYAYGLPDAGDIQEDAALAIATQRVAEEFGRSADELQFVYPYYDITDPDAPRWKFVFYAAYDEALQINMLYRVELDAKTGDVLLTDAFERFTPLQDLETTLKLY